MLATIDYFAMAIMNKVLTVAVLAALAGGAWWWQAGKAPADDKNARAKRPPVVALAPVQPNRLPVVLTANGTVTALDRVEVKPQVSGVVSRVPVQEGSMVKAGTLLVQLDDAAERAALARVQAQQASDAAQLRIAERDLARGRDLFRQQFISQSALDALQGKVDSLQATLAADRAAVESARVSLRQKAIYAQVDGRVGAISLSPGALVQPGMATPMLTLTRMSPVAISFTLPEQQLQAVRQAQQAGPLKVVARTGNGAGQCHSGELTFIDSAVDSASGNVLLKARFDNAGNALWPGQFVNVALQAGAHRGAANIPVAALLTGPDGQFAYTVGSDSKAQRIPLTLLAIQNERAIVRGIAPGLKVVVNGGQNVRPGELVTLAPPRKQDASAAAKVGRSEASGAAAEGSRAGRAAGKAGQNLAECSPVAAGDKGAGTAGTEASAPRAEGAKRQRTASGAQ